MTIHNWVLSCTTFKIMDLDELSICNSDQPFIFRAEKSAGWFLKQIKGPKKGADSTVHK